LGTEKRGGLKRKNEFAQISIHSPLSSGTSGTSDVCTNGPQTVLWKKHPGGLMNRLYRLGAVLCFAFIFCGNSIKDDTSLIDSPMEWGQVVDRDGNVYRTVKIGPQWWMAENLRVTKAPDGSPITSYAYNNDEDMALVYGRLYTWQTMMNGSTDRGAQGISPAGWHIPSLEEWQVLTDSLGGNEIAGGKMKEPGTEHWGSPNVGATNSSGLTLVASGSYVISQDRFCDLKAGAHILTSSSEDDSGIFVAVASHSANIGSALISKTDIAFSVRCVKTAGK
jgi:uncharacterized protein (TIGR02145 family)